MRFHATAESVQNGEITILAIIECILSVLLYFGICILAGSFRYLAWPIVLAPLMLFRTERSAKWALRQYIQFNDLSHNRFEEVELSMRDVLRLTGAAISYGIVGSSIRIVSPLYWFIRKPLEALKEAPTNWQRQCLCSDFFLPPEIVPLASTENSLPLFLRSLPDVIFAVVLIEIMMNDDLNLTTIIGQSLACILCFLIGVVPPLIYRITFKATAIAYLPFLWIVHWTLGTKLSVKGRLERITKGELEKVRRWASAPVLLAVVGKIALIYGWVDLTFLATKFANQKIMEYFIVPSGWPWWQFTLISDAVITFLLLFFADAALARLESEHAWPEAKVMNTISVASFLRAMFSLLTMSHFFYIAFISVVPPTLKRFFP